MKSRLIRLLAFVIVTTAGTSLLLRSAGVPWRQTGVEPLVWFTEGRQGGDSWRPALWALDVSDTLHLRSRGLYEKVFFQSKAAHKGFQYPPTALLPIRAARAVAGSDAFTALAILNWLSIPALMLASFALFRPRGDPLPLSDRVLLALAVV